MKKILGFLLVLSLSGTVYANEEGFFGVSAMECIRPEKFEQFDKVQDCESDIMWAKKADKYGFISDKGEVLVPLVYDNASLFRDIGFVKKGLTWLAFDRQGKQLYTLKADDIKNHFGDYALIIQHAKKGDKYGLFEKSTGKILIPAKYDELDEVSDDLIGFSQNKKYGFLNLKNRVVVKPIYDGVGQFQQGKVVVYKQGKSGVIDSKGKQIVPFTNQRIAILRDGTVKYLD